MAEGSNGFLFPIGVDLEPFLKDFREVKAIIEEAKKAAAASGNSMSDSFNNVAQAVDNLTAEAVKAARQAKEHGKAVADETAAFKVMLDIMTKLAAQQGKTFDAAKLGKYADAVKGAQGQITTLLSKSAQSFDVNKLKALDAQLKNVTGDFKQLQVVVAFIKENIGDLNLDSQESKELADAIKLLEAAFNDLGDGADDVNEKAKSMKARLKELKAELAELDERDPKFLKLAVEAAELEDKIGDVNEQVRLLASDTNTLDAGIQAIQGLVGGFAALQGIQALLGEENKELEKTLLKVNAAMSILQGLQQVGAVLDKNSALNIFLLKTLRVQDAAATTAQAGASTVLAGAQTTATVATRGLSAALASNPAGILLLAITALVSAIVYFTSGEEDATEATIRYNDALRDQIALEKELLQSFNEKIKESQRGLVNQIAYAKAAGKSTLDVAALEMKLANERRLNAQEELKRRGDEILNIEKYRDNYETALSKIIGLQESLKKGVGNEEEVKKEIAAQQSIADANKARFEFINDLFKEQFDAFQDYEEKALALEKLMNERRLLSATSYAEARLLLAEKGATAEFNARRELLDAELKQELSNVNLTEGEKAKIRAKYNKDNETIDREQRIRQLEIAKAAIDAEVASAKEGSKEKFDYELESSALANRIALEQEGLSLKERANINATYRAEELKRIKQYYQRVATEALNTRISNLNARITAALIDGVSENDKEILRLKKKLLDEQLRLDILGAENTITNEEEKNAKILELTETANAEKLKLDKQYYQQSIDARARYRESVLALENAYLQREINNPDTGPLRRFQLEQEIRQNQLDDIREKMHETRQLRNRSIIDETEYNNRIRDLLTQRIRIEGEIDNAKPPKKKDLVDVLGFDFTEQEQQDVVNGISAIYTSIVSAAQSAAQARILAQQRLIDELNRQIDEQSAIVDKEKELMEKGLASNLATEEEKLKQLQDRKRRETEELKKHQAEANKIARAQIILNGVVSASNLAVSAAEYFAGSAKYGPIIGVVLALAAVATMFSAFQAAKAKSKELNSDIPNFRKGDRFDVYNALKNAPSHEDGGAGLYDERTGKKLAEFEGKEKLFIINRGSSEKYVDLLDAINKDLLPTMGAKEINELLNGTGVRLPDPTPVLKTQREVEIHKINNSAGLNGIDNETLLRIDRNLQEFLTHEKNKPHVIDYGDELEIREGSHKKIIKKKKA